MKVSVALCSYNGSNYIGAQLISIARQTQLPDELVVCDDGSSDDTVAIVRAFAETAPFRVFIYANPINLGSNLNFEGAIRRCSGDIIFLSDQDDIWREDKVERMCRVFETDPDVGLAFSDGNVIGTEAQSLGYRLWEAIYFRSNDRRRLNSPKFRQTYFLRRTCVTGAAAAFRSKFVANVLPIPHGWVHDWWISLVIANLSKISAIEAPLIHYRHHGRNQIGAPAPRSWNWLAGDELLSELNSQIEMARSAQYGLRSALGERQWSERKHYVEGRLQHLEARSQALLRCSFSITMRELILLRYARYSTRQAFKGFLLDIAYLVAKRLY